MRAIGECLYSYRIHPHSITKKSPAKSDQAVREVLRRTCERRGLQFEELFGSNGQLSEGKRLRNQDMDNNLAAHFIESVMDLRTAGRLLEAVRTGLRCTMLHPMDPHYGKALAYSMLPLGLVKWLRARRTMSRLSVEPGMAVGGRTG